MDVFYETKQILEKYKIRANKELGQNFLIDENVINKISYKKFIIGIKILYIKQKKLYFL